MTLPTYVRSALALVLTTFLAGTAQAQSFRAYLASTGNDAHPCTLLSPCRLLPAALAVVADGGEVWMLDSANYNTGPVNITKSLTILAVPGALGSVVAAGGNAINIDTFGVRVALRNLAIVPLPGGGGTNGISMTVGGGLTVENCLIAHLPQSGIFVNAGASVLVTDSTIRDNGMPAQGGSGLSLTDVAGAVVSRTTISGNYDNGIRVAGSIGGTTTTADIADSTIGGGFWGVSAVSSNATAVVKVSIQNSRVVRTFNIGVIASSTAGAPVTVSVSNSTISNITNAGVNANPGTRVLASGNTVSGNGYGFVNAGGVLESAGNNAVRNNGPDKRGVITVVAME